MTILTGSGGKGWLKTIMKTRLVVAGFILALVGWFLLGVVCFGSYFEAELLAVERLVSQPGFVWGLRLLILAAVFILIRRGGWLTAAWQKRWSRYGLWVIFGVGLVGWIAGLISLITAG